MQFLFCYSPKPRSQVRILFIEIGLMMIVSVLVKLSNCILIGCLNSKHNTHLAGFLGLLDTSWKKVVFGVTTEYCESNFQDFLPYITVMISCDLILKNYWMRFFWLFWVSQKPNLIIVILYIERKKKKKNGSHVFASSLTASNTKQELDMITLRNYAPRSYTTWLPVILTWLLYNLQLDDVTGADFENSRYTFGQSEKW